MDRSVLLVLCLVTLSNVELGQSQCDGKGVLGINILSCMIYCTGCVCCSCEDCCSCV